MTKMTYRSDIDGLRAFAVLAVILFHLEIPFFTGGFVGVDIFFVISGYLITSIIKGKIENNAFSLKTFYIRRFNRLFPALFTVVLGSLLIGAFLIPPDLFLKHAHSAIASIFSVSNILFYSEAGYWNISSITKPLLHTWSLSVEEQFYLFWPVFLIIIWRLCTRRYFYSALTVTTLISAIISIWYSQHSIDGAFFLTPFRLYQFSAGALAGVFIAFLSTKFISINKNHLSDLVSCICIITLCLCIVKFDEKIQYQSYYALMPTIATMLLITTTGISNKKTSLIKILLENPISKLIGRTSYSLYLVHWPLIVLYGFHTNFTYSAIEQLLLLACIFLSGVILYNFVEKKFHQREHDNIPLVVERKHSNKNGSLYLISTAFLTIAFSCFIIAKDGIPKRFKNIQLSAKQIQNLQKNRFSLLRHSCLINSNCQVQESDKVILFLGNSHEPDGFNFFYSAYGNKPNIKFIHFGTINQCKELRKSNDRWISDALNCQSRLDSLFNHDLLKKVDLLVYAANKPFARNKKTMLAILSDLKNANHNLKLITMGGYLNTRLSCPLLINKSNMLSSCSMQENITYSKEQELNSPMKKNFEMITDHYIDRFSLHCGENINNCEHKAPNGIPFTADRHHLTLDFSLYSGKKFAEQNPNFLEKMN